MQQALQHIYATIILSNRAVSGMHSDHKEPLSRSHSHIASIYTE